VCSVNDCRIRECVKGWHAVEEKKEEGHRKERGQGSQSGDCPTWKNNYKSKAVRKKKTSDLLDPTGS
jgi:hypothetical protein